MANAKVRPVTINLSHDIFDLLDVMKRTRGLMNNTLLIARLIVENSTEEERKLADGLAGKAGGDRASYFNLMGGRAMLTRAERVRLLGK